MAFTTTSTVRTFGGTLLTLSHKSAVTRTDMTLRVFLPPASNPAPSSIPTLFFLSGLTCTPANCSEKGFFTAHLAREGMAMVWPDTSPRGTELPGEHDSWDFGSGAGFYLTAKTEGYREHYNMFDYVTKELPELLWKEFPQLDGKRVGVLGHSMGGHGALVASLKTNLFKSVSAFSPISNPIECAWGQKAFKGYLGPDVDKDGWKEWDTTEILKKGIPEGWEAKVDVGTADNFLKDGQLRVDALEKVAGDKVQVGWREGYDHSYFFVSTFAEDHVKWHKERLTK